MFNHSTMILFNYISVFVMFACCVLISTQTGSKMQKLALLVSVCLTMSSIGLLFKSEAVNATAYILGQKIGYAFIFHGLFLMFLFILEYCRFSIPKFFVWFFESVNFLITFAVLTMDYHTLFYKSYSEIQMDGYVVLEKEYGILHTLAVALFLIYVFAIIVTVVIFMIKNIRRRSTYVLRLLISVLIPFTAYVIPKLTDSNNNFHVISLAIFSVIMIFLIYRNNLYDVDNIAAKLSIASMEEAFIVFDDKYRFQGCNAVAEKLFPLFKNLDLDSDIREYDDSFADYIDGKTDKYRSGDLIYKVSVRSLSEGYVIHGKVLKVEDVTLQTRYTDLLKERQAQIDNDLAMAKTIQLSVLPSTIEVFSNVHQLETASFMETAREVGGDFYDYYMIGDNLAVFIIADVSGKGIPAAMFMMRAKTVIKSLVEKKLPVNEIFNRANNQLCEGNDAGMFTTAWIGILDISTGKMTFSNAGHNLPVILRADGTREYIKCKSGFVLAGMEDIKYTLEEIQFAPGDRLYLYTDGVTEATDTNNELYGEDRLLNLLASTDSMNAEQTLKAVKEDIDKFVGEAEQFDDISMLIVYYLG